MPQKFDYILVGQGIAGSILGYFLQKAGQKVCIISDSTLPSSSQVAAGIYNPVTGKRLSKTWMLDEISEFLEHFYRNLEGELSAKFLHEKPIYRPFRSIAEQNDFTARTAEYNMGDYIQTKTKGLQNPYLHEPFGGLVTSHSGWLDIPDFLKNISKTLTIRDEVFEVEQLCLEENSVKYQDIEAEKIIFCQGFLGTKNPYFNWLPFLPVKGEILNISLANTHFDEILNQGIFLMPLPDGSYKLGATYNWESLDNQTTKEAKDELIDKFKGVISDEFTYNFQQAGVRPATKDRRPFLGLHPVQKQVGIFNGLGTKGVSLAPYWAKHFTEHLIHQKELHSEVNINRFYPLYLEKIV
jgi:glycine/D-amino acid oxidase-like deaminating enzyme